MKKKYMTPKVVETLVAPEQMIAGSQGNGKFFFSEAEDGSSGESADSRSSVWGDEDGNDW